MFPFEHGATRWSTVTGWYGSGEVPTNRFLLRTDLLISIEPRPVDTLDRQIFQGELLHETKRASGSCNTGANNYNGPAFAWPS